VRSTAAPYTESRLTRSVANERVGFPVVEQSKLLCTLRIAVSGRSSSEELLPSTVTSPGDHPPSSSPDEFRSAASSARACSAQLTQTHCLGGRAAPLPEAPRPRSRVLPSGASRSNGLCLGLSPSSVRISWRLTRFLSCISGDTQTRAEAVHPHIPSVATCIVIAYRVQFEHHKPLAGREKWIT